MSSRTIKVGGGQGRGDPPLTARHVAMRHWWIEFAAGGAPLVWTGEAVSEQAAVRLARLELARDHPEAEAARVVACLDRAQPLLPFRR